MNMSIYIYLCINCIYGHVVTYIMLVSLCRVTMSFGQLLGLFKRRTGGGRGTRKRLRKKSKDWFPVDIEWLTMVNCS